MTKINRNNKWAFSLFETLVVMGIVAIFVTACANVFTKKRTPVTEKSPHGRFECYYKDGTLRQQYILENIARPAETVSVCKFKPIRNAQYYIINLVGGGGAGAAGGYGGNAGGYNSFFITNIEKELQILPGRGAAVGGTAGESVVDSVEASGTKRIATVSGGGYGFKKDSMDGSKVSNCSITEAKYTCSRQPYCAAYTEYVQVSYCTADDINGENEGAYETKQLTFQFDLNPITTMSGNTVTYSEPNGNYKFSMTVDTNMSSTADISQFNTYLKAIGVETDIITAAPGNGGAAGQPGNDGGAVIIW